MRIRESLSLRVVLLFLIACSIMSCRSNSPVENAQTNTSNQPAIAAPPNSNAPAAAIPPQAAPQNANQQVAQSAAAPECGDCWAQFFDHRDFDLTDDHHKLCGPGKWPVLRGLPGSLKRNWSNEIESIRVGPSATVIVWTEDNFAGISHTFNPGEANANLRTIPNLPDNISSIEIRCR